ncbi:insensitive isoform 2-T2 [Cochliomyia hominivorax]
MAVMVGSANNFRGIPEPGDHNNKRPLMVNAWSQTLATDFSYLNHIENREKQSQREKELEEKVRVLEENLKAHTELLSQIHATSARTSALLGQQQQLQNSQPPQHQYLNNANSSTNTFRQSLHNSNLSNSNCDGGVTQISPKIVNAINPIQAASNSPAESVKYTIIAEGTGNHNDEPIEIQLAEDDGALNLNSSADSGRLEICLAPEDNIEIKTEYNATNNTIINNHQQTTNAATAAVLTPTSIDSTPTEYNFIKKRKVAVKKLEVLSGNSKYINNDQPFNSYSNSTPNDQLHKKRRSSGNSLLKTPNMQNNTNGDVSHVGIDTENVMVSIGPNNTRIPAKIYENMNWSSASIATRKLLMAIFDRKVLATHSMTGKPSPAFKDHGKPIKQMLDPHIIADIIFAVTRKCNVSDKEVRNAITTKCADENKMMKLQMNKRTPMRELNKENIVGDFKPNFS